MAPNFRRSRLLHDDPALDSTPAPQSHHHPLVNHALLGCYSSSTDSILYFLPWKKKDGPENGEKWASCCSPAIKYTSAKCRRRIYDPVHLSASKHHLTSFYSWQTLFILQTQFKRNSIAGLIYRKLAELLLKNSARCHLWKLFYRRDVTQESKDRVIIKLGIIQTTILVQKVFNRITLLKK